MNIFAPYSCPIKSAKALDDKRLIKMVLESAQILCTAIFLHSNQHFPELYKPTHKSHPCVIWASKSNKNWLWLYKHLQALCNEYTQRFTRKHRTETLLYFLKKYYRKYIPKGNLSEFVNCTYSAKLNIDLRTMKNIHQAYKKYLQTKWVNDRNPLWTKSVRPSWIGKNTSS